MAIVQEADQEISFKGTSTRGRLVGIVLIMAVIAGYIFFTKPLADGVAVIKADITSKNEEIATLKTEVETLQKAEQEFSLSTEVQRLESLKAIPVDMDQDEVIRDLVQIAATYDIELNSISFGKGSSAKQEVGALRVNASFEGSYNDLTDFLQGLEQNARLFKVDSISVQVSKVDVSNFSRATFSLTIDTFFQN